ncbi:protein of unknown function [Candidatus Nitrosacidococcus tergens]|uniref:Uncharacterized protein n=1 Tax=Candidatus Nitrosacidococcus tergens TaxID=553981 RepID=A0A7G1Q810_9GAMM|nr:4'-phosphopantetheinyl transferase superfamily protein [Candidatus Nitrosacidococcus tergens]CAB1274887.1 protein of unknown function [Candidatus Nitrosacidococcus tergens]
MIIGIGTDIIQISRIQSLLECYGNRFAQRILTESEYKEFLLKKKSMLVFLLNGLQLKKRQ